MANKKQKNNFAYIDGNNLYKGVTKSNWRIDLIRFRKWLSDKYKVTKAYYFIGLVPEQKNLYLFLQEAGYVLVFKEISYDKEGNAKGNCDADLVLKSVIDAYENSCDKQVLITSDGDFSGLAKFLDEKGNLETILSPSIASKCSILLKRTNLPIVYLKDVKNKVQMKKPPLRTEP